MTIYIKLQEDVKFVNERNFYWKSAFIDQSHYQFRDVREFLQKYHLAKQSDHVIFISATETGLDTPTLSKLQFYIDKLAKSSAAQARNLTVTIVALGKPGLASLLCRLVKTYTASKAVLITTIGVGPYTLHDPALTANKYQVFDYHILTGAPIGDNISDPKLIWGSETNAIYEILSGAVSNVGHIKFIYANGTLESIPHFYFVQRANADLIDNSAIILKGVGPVTDAMIGYFDGIPATDIPVTDTKTLHIIFQELTVQDLVQSRSHFIVHSLDSSMPDVLPTGVTLDKTGRPAWQTIIETKNFL